MINFFNSKKVLASIWVIAYLIISNNTVFGMDDEQREFNTTVTGYTNKEDFLSIATQIAGENREKLRRLLTRLPQGEFTRLFGEEYKIDQFIQKIPKDSTVTSVLEEPMQIAAVTRLRKTNQSSMPSPVSSRALHTIANRGSSTEPSQTIYAKLNPNYEYIDVNMRNLKLEALTTAVRFFALILNQICKNKLGASHKKTFIVGIITDLARLINDSASIYNEIEAYDKIIPTSDGDKKPISVKYAYCADCVSILPIFYDLINIFIKTKRLFNKNDATLNNSTENQALTKKIERLDKFVPFIEGLLAGVRVGAKWFNHEDYPVFKKCTIQMAITVLTIIRALEFYAQMNGSSRASTITFFTIAVSIIAVTLDINKLFKWGEEYQKGLVKREYIPMTSEKPTQ